MTEPGCFSHRSILFATGLTLALLAGCSTPNTPAPVEDRGGVVGTTGSAEAPARALPGAENEGKPGYYTIRKGDTLIRIGLDSGHNWRDIARWNNLDNPNAIEVGQVIRIAPPVGASNIAGNSPSYDRNAGSRPVAPSGPGTGQPPALTSSPSSTSAAVTPTSPPAVSAGSSDDGGSSDEPRFIWPTSGSMLAGFDEQRNKGLDIGGRPGDAVVAAADGRVVYSGAGLRGYGNLIILKHNNTFLTAYAHNRALLVKEDQSVQKGQKIAEMGDTDADRVKLHFEIRRQGKPVDPMRYLPQR